MAMNNHQADTFRHFCGCSYLPNKCLKGSLKRFGNTKLAHLPYSPFQMKSYANSIVVESKLNYTVHEAILESLF